MYMALLIMGIFLWIDAHWFKRLVPSARNMLNVKVGVGRARGVLAIVIILSLLLMIIGYRGSENVPIYTPFYGSGHFNNLLMVFAVICMGMGSSKGRLRSWLRHPMLTGVVIWSCAHLLVNGDLASLILFGGLGAWALISMILINRTDGVWQRPEPGPASGDIKLLVISAVLFIVIATIHILLGYNPFLGSYA